VPEGRARSAMAECLKPGVGREMTELREGVSVPGGIRTRVTGVKGRRPGPLDDGDTVLVSVATHNGTLNYNTRVVEVATGGNRQQGGKDSIRRRATMSALERLPPERRWVQTWHVGLKRHRELFYSSSRYQRR
jgi:hypothetical protein